MWDHDDQRARKVIKVIGKYLAYDYLPFTHVENPGFIQFVNEAWPKYKIPYRKHFSDKVIPDLMKK